MPPTSPQRTIGSATPTSFADHPLLHRRTCANLSQGLWLQPDERQGSQHPPKLQSLINERISPPDAIAPILSAILQMLNSIREENLNNP
jgi:hypothetical protein